MELLFDPAAWASLVTLTGLEIVLGVDNIVVLSILTGRLPKREARRARSAGLALALVLRLLLLSALSWIARLTAPVFTLAQVDFSWRDLILIAGGLFLIVKATQEIHATIEGEAGDSESPAGKGRFGAVIAQVALMDLIFSLDSIVTAVGLARDIEVMAAAICIAIAIMYFAANATGDFIERHPTVKMLALSFLILIGVVLVADGFGAHIPRVYIYFAMAFAGSVEALNIWAKRSASGQHAAGGTDVRRMRMPGEPAALPPARTAKAYAAPETPLRKKTLRPPAPAQSKKAARKKTGRK